MTRLAQLSKVSAVIASLLVLGACDTGAGADSTPAASSPTPSPAAPVVAAAAAPSVVAAPGPAIVPNADPSAPPEIARPYDEDADAAAAIDAALAAARGDQKDVLIVFGANWCPWCRRLEHTLTYNAAVAAELARGFHIVHVDTGARGTGKNAAIAERYGNPTRLGLPVLVVLAPDGMLKSTQETGALEAGDRHDPAAILAFFARVRS